MESVATQLKEVWLYWQNMTLANAGAVPAPGLSSHFRIISGAAVEPNIAVNESMVLLQMKETMGQSVSQVPQVFAGPTVFVAK